VSPADGGPSSCPGSSVEYGTQLGHVGTHTVVAPPAGTGADPAPDPGSVPEVEEIPVHNCSGPTIDGISSFGVLPRTAPAPVPSKAGCAETAVGRWAVEPAIFTPTRNDCSEWRAAWRHASDVDLAGSDSKAFTEAQVRADPDESPHHGERAAL
jgi:hypothetical protein